MTKDTLEKISGWILPDGTWHACEDWWHISALYDLCEKGLCELSQPNTKTILNGGDEETIRNHVASLGFIRVSRKMIDGHTLSMSQLHTLQELLEICSLDVEIGILGPDPTSAVRQFTIERLLKIKNPSVIFPTN